MTAALEVAGIRVTYGEAVVLRDVDLTFEPGTVTGLIGPNGAGKTTLLDVISGFVRPDRGSVALDGRSLSGLAPHRRARLGLARTFQSTDLFGDMTVGENLAVAGDTVLDDRRPASELPVGERRRLALSRAMSVRPRVLLLDEPAAGLSADERDSLKDTLRGAAESGTRVVIVDHDLSLVLDVCDRVVVLDFGAVIANGTPEQVRTDPAVTAAYVGATPTPPRPAVTPNRAEGAALSVRRLRAGYAGTTVVDGVDLEVAAGEVVALLGPNGAGKTTTLLALAGALREASGEILVLGRRTRPGKRVRDVACVLQDRRVFGGLTTAENLRLVDPTDAATRDVLELFPELRPVLHSPAGRLSGGQQQMLAVARALAMRPRLLLIDELTLGLAPRIVTALLESLTALARESGTAVLLAEQHAAVALSVADRAYVMSAGRVVDSGSAASFATDRERLARAYLGSAATPSS